MRCTSTPRCAAVSSASCSAWLRALCRRGGAVGQDLRRTVTGDARLRKCGLAQELSGLLVPVGAENHLQLYRGRPFDAGDQFAVGEAGLEIGPDHVLRPGVADEAVNDDDLAVIAQVEPFGLAPPERQRDTRVDAEALELRNHAWDRRTRAEGVDQHAAAHAASCRPGQGGDHGLRVRIDLEDVVAQVHARTRSVDVGRNPRQRRGIVGQQFHRVAAEVGQPGEVGRQAHAGLVRGRHGGRLSTRQRHVSGPHRLDEFEVPLQPLQAPARQTRPPDQQVGDESDPGQEEDQQQPALGRLRRTPRRHDRQHDQSDRPVGDDGQRAPVQPCQLGHRAPLRRLLNRRLAAPAPTALPHEGLRTQ